MFTMESLFDGIGGFSLAAVHNEIVPLWASEIESFPIQVTIIRFPQMLHVGDITKLDGSKLPVVDIICGGSPCQDLFVAGKRAGLEGERSGLFMEQIRITKEMRCANGKDGKANDLIRPRFFVWENVPGAFSSQDGEDFKAVLEETVRIADDTVLYLDLREGYGNLLGAFWEENSPLLGEFWMLNTGVSPKDAKESFLSQILEDTPLPKYYLSKTACLGILRRAKSRGKELPKQLKTALEIQAGITQADNSSLSSMNDMKSYCINQRDEGIDLENLSGALMETQNIQMQTFVTEPMFCLNDQGGNRMDITENITATLSASMGGNLPIVMGSQQEGRDISESFCPTIIPAAGTGGENQPVLFDNHGKDCRYNGPLKVAPTVAAVYGTGGNNIPLVSKPIAYSLDSKDSNSMKSLNPLSGCRETDKSRTRDTANPDPSKNQGGIAIVQESYCIASNAINLQDHNGGNGHGVQKDISYTLATSDIHAIYKPEPYQDVVGTLCNGDWKGAGNQYFIQDKCVVNNQSTIYGQSAFADYKEGCGTLRAEDGDNGGRSENLAVSKNLVRRLTPLEYERLKGFPDGWTDIPKSSDSPRYKALGNSAAIPCVDFVLRGIAFFLQKIKEEQEVR